MILLRHLLLLLLMLVGVSSVWGDSTLVHRVEADVVPSYVIQSNRYLRGANPDGVKINTSMPIKLKYT